MTQKQFQELEILIAKEKTLQNQARVILKSFNDIAHYLCDGVLEFIKDIFESIII